jgi:glutamine synthetase
VVCERAVAALASIDIGVRAAFEYEFRLYDAKSGAAVTPGRSYSLGDLRGLADFLDSLRRATDACGIELSALHTEAGPGLVEVNLAPAIGVTAADQAALLKAAVSEIAMQHEMRASFLAKPTVGQEGSGGHLHVSLVDADGTNLFAGDLRGGEEPSAVLRHSVAGLLEQMAALSVIYNPSVNSYKRLVPGWFAPISAGWAIDDRTAAVRVVASGGPSATHLELRRPGADASPHLVLAAAVISMLSGVERVAEPPLVKTTVGDDYETGEPLPSDLGAALRAFCADDDLRRRLGGSFCAHYAATREWELNAWQQVVTDWERTRVEGEKAESIRYDEREEAELK